MHAQLFSKISDSAARLLSWIAYSQDVTKIKRALNSALIVGSEVTPDQYSIAAFCGVVSGRELFLP